MRRLLSLISLAALLPAALDAQAPPKKTSRVKGIVSKMVDTAATSAASTATDSLLGSKAASVAGLVGAAPPAADPTCPAGTVMVPVAQGAGAPAAPVASPGGMIVNAAKKKLAKKPDSTPPAPNAAQFTCMTAEQAAAQNAQASGAATPGAGSMVGAALAATPQGMLVTGAIAAAPMAGKGVKALGGMLGRGVKKENVIRDLARGRLQLKSVRFIEGSDAMKEGFEAELAFVAEALQSIEGNFILTIQPESDGKSPPDTVMVRRRLVKLATYLQVAGIPETRVSVAGGLEASLTSKPSKPKDVRIEITRVPEEPKQ